MTKLDRDTAPCSQCGETECEGAPRFKGICPKKLGLDRGAFDNLLSEAKALGVTKISFDANLSLDAENPRKWQCWLPHDPDADTPESGGSGRTGKEALRRLIEQLRRNSNTVASSGNGA